VRPKTKLFAVKLRRILEVLCLQDLQKRLWVQFHNLCYQKRSCLPWNSDAFWKFSARKFHRKCSGRNSTICASKNESVCREVQTNFGSSLPPRFTEKVVGAIPRFVRPKTKLFAVKFRRILEVLWLQGFTEKVLGAIPRFVCPKSKLFAVKLRRILEVLCLKDLQKRLWVQFHNLCYQKRSCLPWNSDAFWKYSACKFYRKCSGRNSTNCASKNKAVFYEVQAHFGSSLPPRFTEKVVGAIPRFFRPRTKLFAVKFRCI